MQTLDRNILGERAGAGKNSSSFFLELGIQLLLRVGSVESMEQASAGISGAAARRTFESRTSTNITSHGGRSR